MPAQTHPNQQHDLSLRATGNPYLPMPPLSWLPLRGVFEIMSAVSLINIPHKDFSISSYCCKLSTRGITSHAHHRTLMPPPRANTRERWEFPNPNLPAMARGEKQYVIGTESESSDDLWVIFDDWPDCSIGGVHDFDGIVAGTDNEGTVRGDSEGAACVELMKRRCGPVVFLQRPRCHERGWSAGGSARVW